MMNHAQEGAGLFRIFPFGFLIAYLLALGVFVVGQIGFSGSVKDPFAGVYLIPLGLPWVYVFDFNSLSDNAANWLRVLSPVLNYFFITATCGFLRRRTIGA